VPVVPASWEAEEGGLLFETSLGNTANPFSSHPLTLLGGKKKKKGILPELFNAQHKKIKLCVFISLYTKYSISWR
jgi:hypothetical protein